MTIQKILTKFEPKKENLLAVIKEINREMGYVSEESIRALARHFEVKPAAVFSAASFYEHIRTKPSAQLIIEVCDGANCAMKQAENVIEEIEQFFSVKAGDEFSPRVSVKRVGCLWLW